MDRKHTGASIAGFGFWVVVACMEFLDYSPPKEALLLSFLAGLVMIIYGISPWISDFYGWVKKIQFRLPFYIEQNSSFGDSIQDVATSVLQLPDSRLVISFDEGCSETTNEMDDRGYVRGSRTTYWVEIYASGQDYLGVEVMIIRMHTISQPDFQQGEINQLPSNTRLPNRDGGKYVMNITKDSSACVDIVSFSDGVGSFRLETEPYRKLTGEWGNRNFEALTGNTYKLWLAVFSEGQFVRIIEGMVKMKNDRPIVEFHG